jgi:glycosyltransferase involved in cell wall biosynthesis
MVPDMKIGVLMNVFNEAEWLRLAIDSVLSWCGSMVIVEGAYGIAIEAGAPERSDDGTLDILESYKENPKVTIIHANKRDEAPQLQVGLEELKKQDVDWYLLVDGDEVWKKQDLQLIKAAIRRGEKNGIYQYRVNFINFINSFDRCYPSVMKRVFKLTPGAVAVGQNGLAWPDHQKSVDIGGSHQSHISTLPEVCKCYHYTEIKAAERWLLKKRYLKVRDGNPRFDAWHVTKDGFVNGEKSIMNFRGTHPASVKETKLYKLWEKDPELLRQELFGSIDE